MNERKSIDEMIDELSGGLRPAKPLAHPVMRIIPFLTVSIIYVGLLVYFTGIRRDINEKLLDPAFMIEIVLMGLTTLSAGIAVSYMSIPDMRGAKWITIAPFITLGLFCLWNLARALSEGLHMPHLHLDHCMGEGIFMSVIPLTMLIMLIRGGATTHPFLSVLMSALTAAGLGYLTLRFTCAMDTVGHATISHLIPYVVIGIVLAFGARKLFKW